MLGSLLDIGNSLRFGSTAGRWSEVIAVDLGQNSAEYTKNIQDNIFAFSFDFTGSKDQYIKKSQG